MKNTVKGSVLSSVMISALLAGILVASVSSLMNFQRKQIVRQQLKLNSANAAEAAIDYAYTYIVNDAEQKGLDASTYVPNKGGSPKEFTFTGDVMSFLKNKNSLPSSLGGAGDPISYSDIKVVIMPRPASGPVRIYVNPKDPANKNNPNRGQWVYQEAIPVVAAVKATQGGINYVTYVQKDINYVVTNLFQHAIFFQGDLHLHRGFKAMGSVHSNSNVILNAQNNDHAIYNGFVTSGARFYRGSITDQGGTGMDAYGLVEHLADGTLDPSKFSTGQTGNGSNVETTAPKDGDIPIYVERTDKSGKPLFRFVAQKYDLRYMKDEDDWYNQSKSDFNGHLEDKSHDVPIVNPIGSFGYIMDRIATPEVNEFKNGPYFLIEPLLPKANARRKSNYRYNLSANASLVLRVEFIARPDIGQVKTWKELTRDPNTELSYQPTGSSPTMLPVSQDPSYYIVRAYKKKGELARASDPASDRIAIPFPTDVIGRADYKRMENSGSYAESAGTNPQPIDILGTEAGITNDKAATFTADGALISPARAKTFDSGDTAKQTGILDRRVLREAWHRYRIEPYRASSALPAYKTWDSTYNNKTKVTDYYPSGYGDVLPQIGIPPVLARTPPAAILKTATAAYPLYGLHDSRLGRGAHLLTLDISRLKEIMEEDLANVKTKYGAEAEAFRLNFNNDGSEWNGIIYVEFPTSTDVDLDNYNAAPSTSIYAGNFTHPETADETIKEGGSYLDSYAFKYYDKAETRLPFRSSNDNPVPKDRTDNVVPIAKEFRTYPSSIDASTITDPVNAIMALQIINAKRLPRVKIAKGDGNQGNALKYGFTVATNAPIYLIGSWNSDGNYTTGTNVTSNTPDAYATVDDTTLIGDANPEIPSAIFCDTFTVLSPGWATQTNYPTGNTDYTHREYSYFGAGSASKTYREVKWRNDNERIEISAALATGEFPVFEFFTHALEDFNLSNGTPCTPLVFKGSMVGMFTSEIQHFKTAYGRPVVNDPQDSYAAHGAFCFPSPRLHRFIIDGEFPPGTPQALVPTQSNFQILSKSDDMVKNAGL